MIMINVTMRIRPSSSIKMRKKEINLDSSLNPNRFFLLVDMFHQSTIIRSFASFDSFSSSSSSSSATSSSSPPSPLYRIAKIAKDGKVQYEIQTISEILKGSSMHVRDLFSLNLTSTNALPATTKRKNASRHIRPAAAILPRENDIIISFGTIRALIGIDSGILFDAHKPTVQLLADDMSHTFQHMYNNNHDNGDDDNDYGYDDIIDEKRINMDNKESFELDFLEEILRDGCDTYARRLKIYQPIVDSILSRVTDEMFAATGIHRLVPVKDSIQEFEIHVQSALDCLKDLLMNDEDMVALLLTKRDKARKQGRDLDLSVHEDVELLIEEYARRLNTILHETKYLLKKVESKQELIGLSLDAYRNRMLRMNLYLSIAGIGIGTSTAVAGFFGMNLISGLEDSSIAFGLTVVSTSVAGIFIGVGCISYISGSSMQRRTMERLNEIMAIDGALSHMSAIDYAVKYMVMKNKSMGKDEFAKRLAESQLSSSQLITENEIDLLFDAFDSSKDGKLFLDDFQSHTHINMESKGR